MVIGVHTHVLEVVVLASGTDTLLCVCSSSRGIWAALFAEKYRHKLIHAGVGKKKVWCLRHEAGRRHNGVFFSLEKIQKILPYFPACEWRAIAHLFCRHAINGVKNFLFHNRIVFGPDVVPDSRLHDGP